MPYNDLRKGRYSEARRIYFITTVTHHRKALFHDIYCARTVIGEMRRLHHDEVVNSQAWVLMPDHLHWLFALQEGKTLGQVVNLFKGRSARSVNQLLNQTGHIWQRAYYDHALREEEDVRDIARYIVANPLRAGLVTRVGHYPHWDAVWL